MSENSTASAPVLAPERLANAYTYESYRQLIDDLLAQGRTTGPNQSGDLLKYARLNEQRMSRIDKTVVVQPELQAELDRLQGRYVWLVLTEGWCGDAAQIVPVFEAVVRASHQKLKSAYLLRDENLDLMDRYLTNGGRSIPKLIVLQGDTLTEVATWGPRPAPAQEMFQRLKEQQLPFEEFATQLHGWYAKDRTQSTQQELRALLQQLA
ncbi:thioredoxin family protein [Hymenobacter latericus]|uniref:thioredoxin family protein n=1 Tax=Hymenobacter sp. YIM 151858-1 TaxID=2987688 RepID=UPI0022277B04|nr:thioredoxin family protein [Hymenobacter sp. YIM 151858-1]UYZ58368.1 thioredoxin family protein [Hymenobacter sp. YIM 151858-1]